MAESSNGRASVLKEYYSRYLLEVRKLKHSSVVHYYDALNNISRRLKEKNLIKDDIYEVMDIDYLIFLRDSLYADKDFLAADERGNRMYSAGLNNYIRFAQGKKIITSGEQMRKMDTPIMPEKPIIVEQTVWRRSNILRNQAIEFAENKCEINPFHQSFISEKDRKMYMEGHHALPMKLQDKFDKSLDVYANIICLCPLCHRQIHYGLKKERQELITRLYLVRADRLIKSGLEINKDDFVKLALR